MWSLKRLKKQKSAIDGQDVDIVVLSGGGSLFGDLSNLDSLERIARAEKAIDRAISSYGSD